MHGEALKYQVYVLWVKGHGLSTIAAWMGLRPKQVAGLVDRGPYPNRSAMKDEERQAALEELRSIRFGASDGQPLDGGRFDRFAWKIEPLTKEQVRG